MTPFICLYIIESCKIQQKYIKFQVFKRNYRLYKIYLQWFVTPHHQCVCCIFKLLKRSLIFNDHMFYTVYVISRSDVNNLNTHGFAYLMNTSDILTKWIDHPGARKLQPPHEPKSTLTLLWNKPPLLLVCCGAVLQMQKVSLDTFMQMQVWCVGFRFLSIKAVWCAKLCDNTQIVTPPFPSCCELYLILMSTLKPAVWHPGPE